MIQHFLKEIQTSSKTLKETVKMVEQFNPTNQIEIAVQQILAKLQPSLKYLAIGIKRPNIQTRIQLITTNHSSTILTQHLSDQFVNIKRAVLSGLVIKTKSQKTNRTHYYNKSSRIGSLQFKQLTPEHIMPMGE